MVNLHGKYVDDTTIILTLSGSIRTRQNANVTAMLASMAEIVETKYQADAVATRRR